MKASYVMLAVAFGVFLPGIATIEKHNLLYTFAMLKYNYEQNKQKRLKTPQKKTDSLQNNSMRTR